MLLRTPMTEVELERWETRRTSGKWKFVSTKAAIYALGFFLGWNIMGGLLYGSLDHLYTHELIYSLIGSIFLAPFAAMLVWWENDSRYQNTILDEKIRKGLELDNY